MSVRLSSMNLQKRRCSATSPAMDGERWPCSSRGGGTSLMLCVPWVGNMWLLNAQSWSGSYYYNYKGVYSIVIMSLVDVPVVWCGRSRSQLRCPDIQRQWAQRGHVQPYHRVPPENLLPSDDEDTPYFLLADDAFALRSNLMKPYSTRGMTRWQAMYIYGISRGHRVVENAFGIMANWFRVLLGRMQQSPEVVQLIVKWRVILHNMMCRRYPVSSRASLMGKTMTTISSKENGARMPTCMRYVMWMP